MGTNQDAIAALKRYIQTEKDGFTFYQYCGERTSDPRGKEMFLSLARDEIEHLRKLEAEYDSLLNQGAWLSLNRLEELERAEARTIFPFDKRRVRKLIKPDANDLDALQVGIQMEKESYSAYISAQRETDDEDAKAVFGHLAEEEHRHLETLESTYEYLGKTGEWFQVTERPIFEG